MERYEGPVRPRMKFYPSKSKREVRTIAAVDPNHKYPVRWDQGGGDAESTFRTDRILVRPETPEDWALFLPDGPLPDRGPQTAKVGEVWAATWKSSGLTSLVWECTEIMGDKYKGRVLAERNRRSAGDPDTLLRVDGASVLLFDAPAADRSTASPRDSSTNAFLVSPSLPAVISGPCRVFGIDALPTGGGPVSIEVFLGPEPRLMTRFMAGPNELLSRSPASIPGAGGAWIEVAAGDVLTITSSADAEVRVRIEGSTVASPGSPVAKPAWHCASLRACLDPGAPRATLPDVAVKIGYQGLCVVCWEAVVVERTPPTRVYVPAPIAASGIHPANLPHPSVYSSPFSRRPEPTFDRKRWRNRGDIVVHVDLDDLP